ncbi:hypothetical protein [Rhodoblastus sp.]|uniref:hypothetical protein n=1 Tax=Rhodoblastus sp. TaxID=1962975 RepID=UPI0035B250DF
MRGFHVKLDKPSILLPTIAPLKAQGVTGARPFRRACGYSVAMLFKAIGLPDVTPFPDI